MLEAMAEERLLVPDVAPAPSAFGIGAQIRRSGDFLRVVSVDPQGPCWHAGIREGDTLVGLEDQLVRTLDRLGECLTALRNRPAISARIIRADGGEYDVELEKQPVQRRQGIKDAHSAVPNTALGDISNVAVLRLDKTHHAHVSSDASSWLQAFDQDGSPCKSLAPRHNQPDPSSPTARPTAAHHNHRPPSPEDWLPREEIGELHALLSKSGESISSLSGDLSDALAGLDAAQRRTEALQVPTPPWRQPPGKDQVNSSRNLHLRGSI